MIEILNELKNNYIFMSAGLAWLSAQLIKTFLNFVVTKDFNAESFLARADGEIPYVGTAASGSAVRSLAR